LKPASTRLSCPPLQAQERFLISLILLFSHCFPLVSLPGTPLNVFHSYFLLLCFNFLSFLLAFYRLLKPALPVIDGIFLHHELVFFGCHCCKCCLNSSIPHNGSFHDIFFLPSPCLFVYDAAYAFLHLCMTLKHFLEISFFYSLRSIFFRDIFFF